MTSIYDYRMRDKHLGQLNLQAERDFPRALFVCRGGMLRSATCAQVMAHYGWNTRAAGTYECAVQQVTPTLLRWADFIFCMEFEQIPQIKNLFPENFEEIKENFRIMAIPDKYLFRDEDLIQQILKYFGIKESSENIKKLFEEPKQKAREISTTLLTKGTLYDTSV